jgi:hypothetical protein
MKKENQIVGNEVSVNLLESIENLILNIRGKQVMLDRDLARLYGVETKSLNQAVKRNIERFPEHFIFQLSDSEKSEVVTKCYHLKELKFSYQNPYAFTEHGVTMLASILKSDIAVKISIKIVDAFISMRHHSQYPTIQLVRHTTSHDRFLIIDDAEVYHISASLKDLGKKLFAFSKLDIEPSAII